MDECGSSHELDSHVLEAQSSIATGSHATSTMRNEAAGSEASPRPSDREKGPAPRSGRPTETGAPHPEKPQVEKTVPNKDGERETRKKTCCEKENLPDSFGSQSERAPRASEAPPLAKPVTNRVGGRERATAAVCLCPAGANRRFALEFCLGLPSNVPPPPPPLAFREKESGHYYGEERDVALTTARAVEQWNTHKRTLRIWRHLGERARVRRCARLAGENKGSLNNRSQERRRYDSKRRHATELREADGIRRSAIVKKQCSTFQTARKVSDEEEAGGLASRPAGQRKAGAGKG